MARRKDHSHEQLTELALDAAQSLIDQHGIHSLSARKIAQSIGYSPGTLYLVFQNLDDLCGQLNLRTIRLLNQQLETDSPALSTYEQAASRLRQIAQTYLSFAQHWPNRWALLFERHIENTQKTNELMAQSIDELFTYVTDVFKILNPQASLSELKLASRSLWCAVHGIAALNSREKLFLTGAHVESLLDDVLQRYLNPWQQGVSQ